MFWLIISVLDSQNATADAAAVLVFPTQTHSVDCARMLEHASEFKHKQQ